MLFAPSYIVSILIVTFKIYKIYIKKVQNLQKYTVTFSFLDSLKSKYRFFLHDNNSYQASKKNKTINALLSAPQQIYGAGTHSKHS